MIGARVGANIWRHGSNLEHDADMWEWKFKKTNRKPVEFEVNWLTHGAFDHFWCNTWFLHFSDVTLSYSRSDILRRQCTSGMYPQFGSVTWSMCYRYVLWLFRWNLKCHMVNAFWRCRMIYPVIVCCTFHLLNFRDHTVRWWIRKQIITAITKQQQHNSNNNNNLPPTI